MVKGIDVSKYQGNVDFNKVRNAGYDFVIINAGYGRYINQKDPYFEQNYKNAKAAGLGVGAYWYSYATNSDSAKEEAKIFAEVIKGKTFEYPLFYDIEDSSQVSLANRTINAMCKAFCGYLEDKGYYVGVYSYASFLESKLDSEVKSKYDIWVAHFGVSKPAYSSNHGMWQYSETGRVNGINAKVDLDYAYKDYPQIMKTNGLNGFTKSSTPAKPVEKEETKPVETPKPTEQKSNTITHVVKYGETLTSIAKKYGVTVIAIAKENSIKNVNLIYAGQKLKITK